MKRKIRLTENKLNRIIKESVKRVLYEGDLSYEDNSNNSVLQAFRQLENNQIFVNLLDMAVIRIHVEKHSTRDEDGNISFEEQKDFFNIQEAVNYILQSTSPVFAYIDGMESAGLFDIL